MQHHANTPAEYFRAVGKENDWRSEKLAGLCALIKSKAPEVIEEVVSNVLRYSIDGRTLCHINAQKRHIGLYVGDVSAIDGDGLLLKGFDVGKGCIRLRKSDDMADEGIVLFVQKAVNSKAQLIAHPIFA